eukprot:gb/GECG01008548.1/.p1 GENE.gb/GECG01008548.1/~~gb/GECG01008548.1/.p1  ORF type:complete len:1307 (+),score=153.86 gb/GECG01008548.1/:1-3921(+)
MWAKRLKQLGSEDVRTRLSALEELYTSLQSPGEKESQIPDDYIQGVTAELSKACTDNNSKVMEKAFQCMPAIINQLGEAVRHWQKPFLQAAIDALGHTKSTVRDAACEAMIGMAASCCIEDVASKIQKLHQHKNWRSREQLCVLYERMLFEIELPYHRLAAEGRAVLSQSDMIHVPTSLSQALSLLEDAQAPVREAAVRCLSALVAVKGQRILQEIERRKIRNGQLDRIVSMSKTMVAELGISANAETRQGHTGSQGNAPSSGLSGRNDYEGTSCDSARSNDETSEAHSVGKAPSKTTDYVQHAYDSEQIDTGMYGCTLLIEQHHSPLWTPGVIGFAGIAGQIAPLQLKGPEHLRNQVEEVLRNLGPTRSTDWKARCDAISKFRGIIAAGKGNSSEVLTVAKPLREALAEQVSDLRSQIVKVGCCAVAELSAAMRGDFEGFAGPIVSNLLKLVINSVSVMACSGHEAILTIIHNAPSGYHRLVPLICKHIRNSRSAKLRSCCGEYLLNITRGWSRSVLEKHWELLAGSIRSLIEDADEDARKLGRLLFWSYSTMFQHESKAYIFDHLDSTAQRLIQQNEDEARQYATEALRRSVTEIPAGSVLTDEVTVHTSVRRQQPREINGDKLQANGTFQKKRVPVAVAEVQDENVYHDDVGSLSFHNVVQQARDASEGPSIATKASNGFHENKKSPEDQRMELKERAFEEVGQMCSLLESGEFQAKHRAATSLSRIAQFCRSSVSSKSSAEIEAYRDALSVQGCRIMNSLAYVLRSSNTESSANLDLLVALDTLLKCPFVVRSFSVQSKEGRNWMEVLRELISPILQWSTEDDERLASTAADVLKQCFLAVGVEDFVPAILDFLRSDNGIENATLELLRVIISTPPGQLYFCSESAETNQNHMLSLMNGCAMMAQELHQGGVPGLRNLMENLHRVNRDCFTSAIFKLPSEPQSRLLMFLETYANHIYHSIQPHRRARPGGSSEPPQNPGVARQVGETSDSARRAPPAADSVRMTPRTEPDGNATSAGVTPQSNVPSFSAEELIHSQGQLEDTLNELFSSQANLLKSLHLVGHVVVSRDINRQKLWKSNKEYIVKAILSTMAPSIAAADSNPTATISAGLAIIRRISRFHAEDISEANMANMVVTELLHTVALYHSNKEIVYSLQKTLNELAGALDPVYLCLAPFKRSLMMFKRNTGQERGDAPEEVVPVSVALKALREILATQVAERQRLSREDVLQFVLDPADQFMSAVRNIFLSTVADLRKNLVLAMVEVCLICEDELEPALQQNLSDPQRKLLAIYVQRAKRTRSMAKG